MNRLQNSNLPFINLSKENLFLVCDMLELDEIGTLMVAIKEYIYEGKEPMLNTKALKSAWNQVIMLMDRKADSYFTRKEQMEKINKNKKEKKVEAAQPQPIEEIPTEAIETSIEEEEFDNNSEVLENLLDEYENIINHTTDAIAKAEISDEVMVVYQAKQAKLKLKEISEKLIEDIDKTNFYKYINEKIEIKTKKLQVA